MTHDTISVRIVVARSAMAVGGRPPPDGVYLSRFDANREFFETIARKKYNPAKASAKIIILPEDVIAAEREGVAVARCEQCGFRLPVDLTAGSLGSLSLDEREMKRLCIRAGDVDFAFNCPELISGLLRRVDKERVK